MDVDEQINKGRKSPGSEISESTLSSILQDTKVSQEGCQKTSLFNDENQTLRIPSFGGDRFIPVRSDSDSY